MDWKKWGPLLGIVAAGIGLAFVIHKEDNTPVTPGGLTPKQMAEIAASPQARAGAEHF